MKKRKYKVLRDVPIGGVTRREGETVDLHPRQAKYLLGIWLEEVVNHGGAIADNGGE